MNVATWTHRLVSGAAIVALACAAVRVRSAGLVTAEAAPAAALALDAATNLAAGPADAGAVVRIFGDYQCPACRSLDLAIGDSLRALAHAGRIRLVYLHRPLASHSVAGVSEAHAIACIRDPFRAWDAHRVRYRADGFDDSVRRSAGSGARALAPNDTAGHGACMGSDTVRDRVRAAVEAARRAGFAEVPAVLVNGERIHFRSYRALLRHIEGAAAAGRVGRAGG